LLFASISNNHAQRTPPKPLHTSQMSLWKILFETDMPTPAKCSMMQMPRCQRGHCGACCALLSVHHKLRLQLIFAFVSARCHRFTNVREAFPRDLSRKLTVGLTSQDFKPLPCNCRTSGNSNCGCNNMCRNSTAVHKVKCNNAGKVHMGNAQQKFKTRMQQRFNETPKPVKLSEKSDSCAKHFSTQFCDTNLSPTTIVEE